MSQVLRENGSAGPPGKSKTRWRLILTVLGIVAFFWLLLAFLLLATGGSISFALLFACALGAGAIVARRRTSQQDSLLWMLAIAADHGMPLATTARALADQFGRSYRRRVLQFAERLNRGESLPDALDGDRRLLSADSRLLVRAGQESGRLGPTLRTALAARSEVASLQTGVAAKLSYLLGLLLIVQGIFVFLVFHIAPRYETVFMDFGLPLPAVTARLFEGAHFLMRYLFWLPALTVILLIWIPFAVAGWTGLNVPVVGRLFRRRHASLILRALTPFVEANQPIERGMDMIADHYPTRWVRRKLTKAALRVHQGADWRAALGEAGLIREADRDALSAATVVGNLGWAMNDLAEAAERRRRVRIEAWAQTLFPVGVVTMGLVVLFVGAGFFMPLVDLIRRLS